MAYRFAQLSLGLVSVMSPFVLAAPMDMSFTKTMDYSWTQKYAEEHGGSQNNQPPPAQVYTTVTAAATSAPPAAPQYQPPAATPASSNNQPSTGGDSSPSEGKKSSSGSTSGGSSGIKGKKGVSFDKPTTLTGDADWCYDWTPKPMGNLNGVTFIPMTKTQDDLAGWNAKDAPACLAFNEPDIPLGQGGSDMDAGTAAAKYKEFAAGCGGQKGAPSVSSTGLGQTDNKSLNWLQKFMSSCSDCEIDFWPLHFYAQNGSPGQFDMFTKYVQDARKMIQDFSQKNPKAGTDIWFTEIGQYGGGSEAFTKQCMDWMDKQDDIKGYSPTLGGDPDDSSSQPTSGSMVAQMYGS